MVPSFGHSGAHEKKLIRVEACMTEAEMSTVAHANDGSHALPDRDSSGKDRGNRSFKTTLPFRLPHVRYTGLFNRTC